MLRLLVFVVCQVCFGTVFGQGYVGYFSKTTAAEVEIVGGNHRAALGLYGEVFGAYEKVFSKDLHNAAVCAVLVGDCSTAFRYLDSLVQQGIGLAYFKSHPGLRGLRKTPEWKNWVSGYALKHDAFLIRQRGADRKELDEMDRLDQEFRMKAGSYAVWGDTIRKTDSLNILHFRKMVARSGYPSDREIGIESPCDLPTHYVVLRHCYQNKWYDLSDLLYQAVVDGDLEPQIYSELEDKQFINFRYGTLAYFREGKWFVDVSGQYSADTLASIDAHRISIGLESLEDYKAKVRFQMKNKLFCFKTYEGVARFDGIPLKRLGKPERFEDL